MDKGQFKAAVIGSIGQKTEDMLDAAKLDAAKQGGYAEALLGVSEKIKALAAVADEDAKAGKYEDLDPVRVLALVKQYITRCDTIVESAQAAAAAARLTCQGRVQALELVMKNLKKEFDLEVAKSKMRAQVETTEQTQTADGTHSAAPVSLKAQRQAEEKPEKVAQADVPSVPAAPFRRNASQPRSQQQGSANAPDSG